MGSKIIDIVYEYNDLDRLEYFDEINRILIKEYNPNQHLKSAEVAFKLGELKELRNHYQDKSDAKIIEKMTQELAILVEQGFVDTIKGEDLFSINHESVNFYSKDSLKNYYLRRVKAQRE